MIRCSEFEDFILDYLDDDLPSAEQRKFDFHLRLCPECRIYLDAYQTSVALGRAVCDELDDAIPESVPEDLVAAVLAAREFGYEGG